jgi:hypothetical protein
MILYKKNLFFTKQTSKIPKTQFFESKHPLEFKIIALKVMGCYLLKVNLPSLIIFQEMNNVVH